MREKSGKSRKTLKNAIDKRGTTWYNMQVAARKRVDRIKSTTDEPRVEKIFEKLFKNLLTNGKRCGIITRSARKTAVDKTVIENWTIRDKVQSKTKNRKIQVLKYVRQISNNSKENYILKQSKKEQIMLERIYWLNRLERAAQIQFFREFDPGSGWTLAACITHSSRTECSNTLSGGRVSNAWVTCLSQGDNVWKRTLIPHNASKSHVFDAKDLLRKDGLASD